MKKLKEIDFKILAGLMKNSKISDRKLADSIGVSQPTITRRRAFLEEKLSLDYTAIPDFAKLGLEIMAFHFTSWKPEEVEMIRQKKGFQEQDAKYLSGQTNLIFASSGQGLGMSRLGITFHKDYSDFVEYKARIEADWGAYMTRYDTFMVSLKSDRVLRPMTLKYLADHIQSANNP